MFELDLTKVRQVSAGKKLVTLGQKGDFIHARFDMDENGDRFESIGFHETSS